MADRKRYLNWYTDNMIAGRTALPLIDYSPYILSYART
jgi:hypothetical protein